MSGIQPPEEWNGRFVPTLEALDFIHDKVRSGVTLGLFMGQVDVHVLSAFVNGVHSHQFCCGQRDEQYMAFIDWLRDVRGEFPSPGGWAVKYLAEMTASPGSRYEGPCPARGRGPRPPPSCSRGWPAI